MLSPLRNRFGIPGVISVIALVFAMLGGAYAASDNGSSGKATASAKAKKGPRGPKGPKGPAGPAGAQGPAGPQGPAGAKGDTGAKGDKGDTGSTGNAGAAGASVTGTPIASGGACGVGVTGVKYTLNSTSTNVCNGKNGEDGEDGESGFTSTLPPGETETGTWAIGPKDKTSWIPLSFNIPLEEAPASIYYVTVAGEEVTNFFGGRQPAVNCLGDAENPTAPAGAVCVYADNEFDIGTEAEGFEPSAPKLYVSGAVFQFSLLAENKQAYGTWAVTAP